MGDMLTAGWKMLVVRGWLLLLSAALSILLGILFVANPGAAAVGIAVFLGLVALMWAAVFVLGGLALRRELTGPQTTSAASSGPA